MSQHSVKLHDRTLWADGDSTVAPSRILDAIASGIPPTKLFVEELTEDIKQYNQHAGSNQIQTKIGINELSTDWNIPEFYKTLNVESYVISEGLDSRICSATASDEYLSTRIQRVLDELALYEQMELMDVLRVLIYIINTLDENKVMWGVGRGSSVASYVLYCIGVHDIDSIKYQLDVTDFLRVTN